MEPTSCERCGIFDDLCLAAIPSGGERQVIFEKPAIDWFGWLVSWIDRSLAPSFDRSVAL